MKLIDIYLNRINLENKLISRELVNSYGFKLMDLLLKWRQRFTSHIKNYISCASLNIELLENLNQDDIAKLLSVIIYHGIPPNILNLVDLSGPLNYIRYLYEFSKLKLEPLSMYCIINVLQDRSVEEQAKSGY